MALIDVNPGLKRPKLNEEGEFMQIVLKDKSDDQQLQMYACIIEFFLLLKRDWLIVFCSLFSFLVWLNIVTLLHRTWLLVSMHTNSNC